MDVAAPPYDPWRHAESRGDLTVVFTPLAGLLGGGFAVRRAGRSIIGLDPALVDGERRAALAHELVHDERGGLVDPPDAPPSWSAVVAREERRVDAVAAERLAPADVLRRSLEELAFGEGGVTAPRLAAELDLPVHLVELALARLAIGAPA